MNLSNELKRLLKDHPKLCTVALAIAIWYGSYHLGEGVGEFLGNLSNLL